MLEYCRKNKGRVQTFVVLRVNRFAHNTEDRFAVRKILLDYGVTPHSVTETIGNSSSEKFIETVLAGAAEYDNAIRKKRCVDGMQTKIQQGLYPWKSPPGYICNQAKKRGEKKTETDKPDPTVFPIIQRGLREYGAGRCSLAELARRLDEWGLSESTGRKTTRQLADRIVGKYLKFYSGVIVNPWTGAEHKGLHQPMISQQEFECIKLVRNGRVFNVKRDRNNPVFPLRRTVLCASCGNSLTSSTSRGNGGKHAYYRCAKRGCSNYGKSIPKAILVKEFQECLNGITPSERFLELFRNTVLDLWNEKLKVAELGSQKWSERFAVLENKRKAIFEMREDGSYSKEEFLERKDEVDNEMAAASISLSECRIDKFDVDGLLAYATKFIHNLSRQWFDLPTELRSRFQKLVFPEGISYDREKGFGTAKLGLIYELNRLFHEQNSSLVHLVGHSWNQVIEEFRLFHRILDAQNELAMAA